jgi:PAS domain S-box-containing protein
MRERLAGIVASAMDAIITVDSEQNVVLFNPAAERMFGYSVEEAMGQPIDRFIPERFRAAHVHHIRRFGKAGTTDRTMGSLGSISGLRSNGEEFPIEASISQVEVDGERLFSVILRDVTERTASEGALIDSRRRMEGIVASAMDAIITVDERQKIVLFNPAAERMFGCPAEEALGASITRFIPERYRAGHDEHIRRFNQTGDTNRRMGALGAIWGLRDSGEEFPIEASISQVVVGGERLSTVILRDITERRTNEETRGLLAREVDHRAKNALAVAQALVTLTKADTIEDYAETVRGRLAALGRAHSLLSQSLWQGAAIEQLIRDELEPYAREGQLEMSGGSAMASADSVQSLSLLFHELVTNAVKYGALSSEDGRIRINWKVVGDRFVIRWTESGGPRVSVPSHEGFGTKLLREVTGRQLAAELNFDWDPRGLRAEIRLPSRAVVAQGPTPIAERTASASDETSGKQPSDSSERRILLVEDEQLVALALSSELSDLGWMVVGPAATLVEAQALLASSFDAAVLDVNLGGRAVYPVAEALLGKRVPFVFCTGYEVADPEGRFPGVPVIRKPVSGKAVSAALRDLLNA